MSVSIAVGLRRFLAAPAHLAAFDDDVGVVARPVDLDLPEAQELRLHCLAHAVLTTLRSLRSPRAEAALSGEHPRALEAVDPALGPVERDRAVPADCWAPYP